MSDKKKKKEEPKKTEKAPEKVKTKNRTHYGSKEMLEQKEENKK